MADEIKYSRNLVSFQVDDPKIKFVYDRGRMPARFANEMVESVKSAIKANGYVSAFLDEFWDENPAVRYQKMLQETLSTDGIKLLTPDEVSLYTTFVGKAELTDQEFLDNFSVIESTLQMDEDKRLASQISIAEEIRSGRQST